jgi:hypothetical protein
MKKLFCPKPISAAQPGPKQQRRQQRGQHAAVAFNVCHRDNCKKANAFARQYAGPL